MILETPATTCHQCATWGRGRQGRAPVHGQLTGTGWAPLGRDGVAGSAACVCLGGTGAPGALCVVRTEGLRTGFASGQQQQTR